jgi:hypothetical protein
MIGWVEAVERIGIAGVTVVFVGVAMAWLGRRFIGRGGLLSKVGERHIQFIDKTEELMHDSLHLQTRAIDLAAEATADQAKALRSTHKMRRAGLCACDVLEKIAVEMEVEVSVELDKVRSELNGGDTLHGDS